jgi:hypothetical protein
VESEWERIMREVECKLLERNLFFECKQLEIGIKLANVSAEAKKERSNPILL